MDSDDTARAHRAPEPGRRIGYVVAAAVNLAMLWFVNQLLGWGWPPFLTDDFSELLPWVDASLIATAVANLAWLVRDPAWFRHLGQIVLNVITFVVAVRTWQIFPFDFSESSDAWDTVVRIVLVVAMVGVVVATIVEIVRLAVPSSEPKRRRGRPVPAGD